MVGSGQVERTVLNGGASLIRLEGRLMLGQSSTADLTRAVSDSIDGGSRALVFDLTGLSHIDSTGIGRFIDAYRRLAPTGGKMYLAGARGAVRDSFRVTKLDTVFSLYETPEEARKAAGC